MSNDNQGKKKRNNIGDFKPGNVASMTAGGAHGAIKRWEQGKEQRPFVQELKAQKLAEIQEVGRLGIATDVLAEMLVLHELFQEQMNAAYAQDDTDAMYRASQELRRLTGQILKTVDTHREEEQSQGSGVILDAIEAAQRAAQKRTEEDNGHN